MRVRHLVADLTATDQNDESLQKWKASLGLGQGKDIYDPNDPRKCIILSLGLEVEGREDIIIDLRSPGAVEALQSKPFTIKEGATFRMKAQFKVQHEILAGLKYLQKVSRMGVSSKMQEMMVGWVTPLRIARANGNNRAHTVLAPRRSHSTRRSVRRFSSPTPRHANTLPVEPETAPSGMLGRGHYEAVSKFVDDDNHTHLQFKWSFDIKKDWN